MIGTQRLNSAERIAVFRHAVLQPRHQRAVGFGIGHVNRGGAVVLRFFVVDDRL